MNRTGTPSPATTPAEAPLGEGEASPLVEAVDLVKHFPIRKGLLGRVAGAVQAVNGVSFSICRGETYAIVGESGCGKTTTGRCLLRLIEPTSGAVRYEGRNILDLRGGALRQLRRSMQIVFQDPYSSLNPRMTVEEIVGEGLHVHKIGDPGERRETVAQLLRTVGLLPEYGSRYPHAFSGGQRQRIGIARALALEPSFLVCDEAVSALDVSIQAQILNLLEELQERLGLTYLFIAHDLSVVRHIADRVGVMYLGHLVEEGPVDRLFESPLHPYTQALLNAIPIPDPKAARKGGALGGDVPRADRPPTGCPFHPRCPQAMARCRQGAIDEVRPEPNRRVRCVLHEAPATPSASAMAEPGR